MNQAPDEIGAYLSRWRAVVDQTIDRHLPPTQVQPTTLHEAMRYAVLGGGKRVRPILAIAAAEACGSDPRRVLLAAASLELIHAYSLVHDDLPALDNDELRRGRKTVHVVYGEAMAILVGDALLTEAFHWLASPVDGIPAELQLRAARTVAEAVNSRGMIGGQVADLAAERMEPSADLLDTVRFIHRNKTGQLITASVLLGGLLAGAPEKKLQQLERYGRAIGLAFQIVDDLLDQEESEHALGKTAGKDAAQGKLTYPAVVGAEAARAEASQLLDTAVEAADIIAGPVNYLAPIGRYICSRRA